MLRTRCDHVVNFVNVKRIADEHKLELIVSKGKRSAESVTLLILQNSSTLRQCCPARPSRYWTLNPLSRMFAVSASALITVARVEVSWHRVAPLQISPPRGCMAGVSPELSRFRRT